MEERLGECLKLALYNNVSDIHFSLKNDEIIIEMRVNDKIRKLKKHPDDLKLFRYLQYKANIDIGDKLKPQTGRFEMLIDNKNISLRFSIINSYNVSSGVLRILNNHNSLKVSDLTYKKDTINYFSNIKNHRSGLYVFSGPTGSGKTTALYTILDEIRQKKIYTLEDPIEVFSDKYIQLQINEKQNLSYAEGIKQLMRHDPDVIMIGEVRDSEAALMAVRCALTGHLVLTSIHSFSCVSAIDRLIELGVDKYQLKDVLHGVSNQRLYSYNKNKIVIYEIMNREELNFYFKYNQTSKSFKSLQQNIAEAVENKIISQEVAFQDLS